MPKRSEPAATIQTAASPELRERWLREVAAGMKGWFDDLGFPVPPFELRTGFPSSGQRSPNITESWTEDGGASFVIFVRPDRYDALDIAAALAFQFCRAAVGDRDSHGHLFRHLATSIGLRGTKTESRPGPLFSELSKQVIARAGALPRPSITPTDSERKTRQTTRLVKVSCTGCGYVVRVSRKWLDQVGPPLCPDHGAMTPSEKGVGTAMARGSNSAPGRGPARRA